MKKSWSDFLEKIDHEFQTATPLTIEGYRMDGADGIRDHVYQTLNITLHGIKACDYLYQTASQCICLEFSDLVRMRENFPISDLFIENCKETLKTYYRGQTRKRALKLVDQLSFYHNLMEEVTEKVVDTDGLLANIRHHEAQIFKDQLSAVRHQSKLFFVIWDDHSSHNGDNDIYRILDHVSDMINSRLNSLKLTELQQQIYLLPLADFIDQL